MRWYDATCPWKEKAPWSAMLATTLCKIAIYLHSTCLWKYRKGKEINILPGLTAGLLSVLGKCHLLCLHWVTGCLPAEPSSLSSYLANVSNFSGAPYKDSALPDLSASTEQSRSFEQLPRISLQLPKIVPVQMSDFHRICGNTRNSGTFLLLCSRLHKGNRTTK